VSRNEGAAPRASWIEFTSPNFQNASLQGRDSIPLRRRQQDIEGTRVAATARPTTGIASLGSMQFCDSCLSETRKKAARRRAMDRRPARSSQTSLMQPWHGRPELPAASTPLFRHRALALLLMMMKPLAAVSEFLLALTAASQTSGICRAVRFGTTPLWRHDESDAREREDVWPDARGGTRILLLVEQRVAWVHRFAGELAIVFCSPPEARLSYDV
jgi:hypothetical protein